MLRQFRLERVWLRPRSKLCEPEPWFLKALVEPWTLGFRRKSAAGCGLGRQASDVELCTDSFLGSLFAWSGLGLELRSSSIPLLGRILCWGGVVGFPLRIMGNV